MVTVVASVATGCGGDREPQLSNRLWIDHLPENRRDPVAALVIGEKPGSKAAAAAGEGGAYGVLYRGSLFRGAFEAVAWTPVEDTENTEKADDEAPRARGTLRLLQDRRDVAVTVETCEPDPTFDACILLVGDPQGVVRYQSRRRWGARGGVDDPVSALQGLFAELATDLAPLGSVSP